VIDIQSYTFIGIAGLFDNTVFLPVGSRKKNARSLSASRNSDSTVGSKTGIAIHFV
jgi:hypothetical protein